MSYHSSDKIITAPIGIGDISTALGHGPQDLGSLCTASDINKWAKYKPEHWHGMDLIPAQPGPVGYLTEAQRKQNHYGFNWWTTLSNAPLINLVLNYSQAYNKKSFVSAEIKRISDFLAFKDSGVPYNDTDYAGSAAGKKGYCDNAVGPVSDFEIDVSDMYIAGGGDSNYIKVEWHKPTINEIALSDVVTINSTSGSTHFGVLFISYTPASGLDTITDILDQEASPRHYKDTAILVWDPTSGTDFISTMADTNPQSSISGDMMHAAGLTPTPLGVPNQDDKSYDYIAVPVLFRDGIINTFSRGYTTISLESQIGTDLNSWTIIPLPYPAAPEIIELWSQAAQTVDLSILFGYDAGDSSPFEFGNNVGEIESVNIYLRGPDGDPSGYSRSVTIHFYHGSDASDYNPTNYDLELINSNTTENIVSNISVNHTFTNPGTLRCRAFISDNTSKFVDEPVIFPQG